MKRLSIRTLFLSILLIFLFSSHAAFAETATLTNIIVTNTRDDLYVYLTVEGAFQPKMTEAIESGVPATFSFLIVLDRVRTLWLNKSVADIKVSHTVKYNSLKKEYTIKRSWENDKPHVTQSFEEARKWMSEIDGLKVVPLNRLEKGEQYQLNAKAELSTITLPFNLHHVLFFVSLWDFETDWYTLDFIY